MPQAEEVSQITDATERLSYVVRLTEAAANRTMDLVENSHARGQWHGQRSQGLEHRVGPFHASRSSVPEEFRDLARRVDGFLTRSEARKPRGCQQPE
jgi:chemotaxis protein CheZ